MKLENRRLKLKRASRGHHGADSGAHIAGNLTFLKEKQNSYEL